MGAPTYKTVDEYIAAFPEPARVKLNALRRAVTKAAPEAKELMSYRMPAFRQHRILVYFAAHREHIGFYPTPSAISAFKKELSAYKTAKGSVQFPLNQPLPLECIKRMVKFRVREDREKTANEHRHGRNRG